MLGSCSALPKLRKKGCTLAEAMRKAGARNHARPANAVQMPHTHTSTAGFTRDGVEPPHAALGRSNNYQECPCLFRHGRGGVAILDLQWNRNRIIAT